MPDYSMPWIYGLISLLLISAAVCVIIKLFDIKSRVLQVLLGALFITFPAETGTLGYMFTAAPYALALFLSVAAVFIQQPDTRRAYRGACDAGLFVQYISGLFFLCREPVRASDDKPPYLR